MDCRRFSTLSLQDSTLAESWRALRNNSPASRKSTILYLREFYNGISKEMQCYSLPRSLTTYRNDGDSKTQCKYGIVEFAPKQVKSLRIVRFVALAMTQGVNFCGYGILAAPKI